MLLEEALERLGETDSAARATILARLAHWLHTVRPYPQRLTLSDRSVAMARGTGNRRTLATVLMHRAWALDGPGHVGDALGVASEILGIGAEFRDPELRLEGLRIRLAAMWDVTVANLEGRFAEAKERSAKHLATFEEFSAYEPANIVWPAITAWCLAETGALDKAAGLLHRVEPAAAAAADKNHQWWAVIVGLSGAVDLLGDRQWAEVLYDLTAPYAGHNATLGVATFLGAADHWLSMGGRAADAERARSLTESAMRTAEELGLTAITNRPRLRR